jgi:hypothetical protein
MIFPISGVMFAYREHGGEAADNGVKVTTTGERADGTAVNGSYTAQYDGKDYPAAGSPYDTIALTRVDANTLTARLKNTTTSTKLPRALSSQRKERQ